MNLPNSITFIRIILVPVMLYYLVEGENLSALIVFAAAALSDGLDGFFAKVLDQKTRLGAFLDPIADKLLLSTSFIALAVMGLAPPWLTIMAVSRDLLIITGIGILAWDNEFPAIKPTIDGKITTFLQVITIVFLLGYQYFDAYHYLYYPLITATALFTAISGTRYMLIGFRLLGKGNN